MDDQIEKYHPRISLDEAFPINKDLPDNELAFGAWKNLISARKFQDAMFLVIGRELKLFRDKKLYRFLDFDTFEQFLASEELSFSREKGYLYIRIYELYVERLHMSYDEIQQLGVARLMLLNPIIKEIEDNDKAIEKLNEYRDMRYSDFVRDVKRIKNQGKPDVYWSNEAGKWIVSYHPNITHLVDLGDYEPDNKTIPESN